MPRSTNSSLHQSPQRPIPKNHSHQVRTRDRRQAASQPKEKEKMSTQQIRPLPLRRHDSATQLVTNNNTKPQPLAASFPCSRRHRSRDKPPAKCSMPPPYPSPQPPKQDRLQTALLYLARAAAQLPAASAIAESLYDFAAPNWKVERWEAEVEGERERGAASARGGVDGEKERTSTGDWVRRAIGMLKREGEEGEYWRDGRDLELLWGRVGGGCE